MTYVPVSPALEKLPVVASYGDGRKDCRLDSLSFSLDPFIIHLQIKWADPQGDKHEGRQLGSALEQSLCSTTDLTENFWEVSQQLYQVRRFLRRARECMPVSLNAQDSLWLKPPQPRISRALQQALASSNSFAGVFRRKSH